MCHPTKFLRFLLHTLQNSTASELEHGDRKNSPMSEQTCFVWPEGVVALSPGIATISYHWGVAAPPDGVGLRSPESPVSLALCAHVGNYLVPITIWSCDPKPTPSFYCWRTGCPEKLSAAPLPKDLPPPHPTPDYQCQSWASNPHIGMEAGTSLDQKLKDRKYLLFIWCHFQDTYVNKYQNSNLAGAGDLTPEEGTVRELEELPIA